MLGYGVAIMYGVAAIWSFLDPVYSTQHFLVVTAIVLATMLAFGMWRKTRGAGEADKGPEGSRSTSFAVLLVALTVIVPPVFVHFVLSKSGSLILTIESREWDPVAYRVFVDGHLMDSVTLASGGNALYPWDQQWFLSDCVIKSVSIEYNVGNNATATGKASTTLCNTLTQSLGFIL